MTTGKQESWDGGCSQGGNGSISPAVVSMLKILGGAVFSLLAKVDLLVPLSPDLRGCEHATRSAHVTEGSLSSSVSSSSRDTGNTGDSATCFM